MRIALTLPSLPLSGIGTSIDIIRMGLTDAGHDVRIVVTGPEAGDDFVRAATDGWEIEASSPGVRSLKERLLTTIDVLSGYDVVINNTSLETQLVFPCLPAETMRLSVVRTLNGKAIAQTSINSSYVDATVGLTPCMVKALEASAGICSPVHLIQNSTRATGEGLLTCRPPIRIAYVGRISQPDKNVFVLPEIAKALLREGCDFTFSVLGDGPALPQLQNLCRETNVADRFAFKGRGTREEALQLLRDSHFACLPSGYEGLSNVMLEAMAIGSVPIVSDIEEFEWVLGDVADDLQSRQDRPDDYARKILHLVRNPDCYREIQDTLRSRQQALFSPSATSGGYVDLISRLARTRDRGAFTPLPFGKLGLPVRYQRQCQPWWRCLQIGRDLMRRVGVQ